MNKRLVSWWKNYRYRFVPWIILSWRKRSVRYFPCNDTSRLNIQANKENTVLYLQKLFAAFETAELLQTNTLTRPLLRNCILERCTLSKHGVSTDMLQRYQNNLDVMQLCTGFTIERKPSTLDGGGTGVLVTNGSVPSGVVTSFYPGVVYKPGDPILLQSFGNSFILRCIDGQFIDGSDRSISAIIYRSCCNRDSAILGRNLDTSWLTETPVNPMAVGQYVNNQTPGNPANVAYMELDFCEQFPSNLRRYIPNVYYQSLDENLCLNRRIRTVVLVSLREIKVGEELFSSYVSFCR